MNPSTRSFALGFAALVLSGCGKQAPTSNSTGSPPAANTVTSFDRAKAGEQPFPAKGIKLDEASLKQVLDLYAEISGRSVIRAGNLPDVKITFSNQTPLSKPETLQALDTVLAAQGIAMVFLGAQYVKAVLAKEASVEPGPVIERAEELPDSSSFVIYVSKLRKAQPSQAMMALQPFCKLPNSIVAVGSGGPGAKSKPGLANLPAHLLGTKDDSLLILRDYSSNVRRMLQVLEKLEER